MAVKAMKAMKAVEEAPPSPVKARKAMKAVEQAPPSPMKAMKTLVPSKFARKSLGMKAMKDMKADSAEAADAVLKKPAAVLKRPAGPEAAEPSAKKKKTSDPKEVLAAREIELKKMLVADLKELVLKMGLEKGGKGDMVAAILKKEKAALEAEQAMAEKRKKVIVEKKKALDEMSVQALKEQCESKGLKTGGSKSDKVERLLEDIKAKGGVDSILAEMARAERRDELSKMSKEDLQKVCSKSNIDPIVKEIMVERILAHEAGLKL